MFYHISQNSSGGSFDFDLDRGITHHVVIEASSVEEAISRAESMGLYWDGVQDGVDCPCCGDRWYPPHDGDGEEFPHHHGTPVSEPALLPWMEAGRECAVHYLDGRIEWH